MNQLTDLASDSASRFGQAEDGLFRPAPTLSILKVGALINTASGSCDADAEVDLAMICERAGLPIAKIWCATGADLGPALEDAKAQALDLLIVLGGDGTIRSAAGLCTAQGPLLIPLPGGTMNMLPKALYGERDWKSALTATLAAPVLQSVSAGQVDGERFYVAGIFGAPSLWARAREAVREGDLNAALSHGQVALEKTFSGQVRYSLPGQAAQAQAVSVLCPLTSKALPADAPALEVAALNPDGALSALKLAVRGLVADWRDDPSVTVHRSAQVELASQEPIPAILDGESLTLSLTETVAFVAQAFTAVRPAPGSGSGANPAVLAP